MRRLALVSVLAGLVLLSPSPVHTLYFPFVSVAADDRFAVQWGWGVHCCDFLEIPLGLARGLGGDHHELIPENDLQVFHTIQWYEWFHQEHPETYLPTHECNYDAVKHTIPRQAECAEWIKRNPGKAWMIANEPNLGYADGGDNLGPDGDITEYLKMWNVVVPFLRQTDATVRIVAAAWVIDHCSDWWDKLISQIDPDIWNIHYYNTGTPDNPEGQRQVTCLLNKTDKPIWITELGWYGRDTENNTQENVVAFMRTFIPWLKTQHRVTRFFWWSWGDGAMLVIGNSLTPAGKEYQRQMR